MKLWTWKLGAALALLALFLFDAFWRGPNPVTGEARHVFPFADTGIASFVFLLVILYVVTHVGQWVFTAFRRWRTGEPKEEEKKKERRRRRKR